MHLARLLSFCGLVTLLASCGSEAGDRPSPSKEPPPAGKDHRIHGIADPASATKAAHNSQVSVSGAVVIAIDRFDETANGKSSGTIYVADLGSTQAYSGISLFNPSFIPGNLRVSPGDVLDLRGTFQENQELPIKFAPGAFLVQLANPIGTFRFEAFEADFPPPVKVDIAELADYAKGRQWLNMVVRVENVKLAGNASGTGRINVGLTPSQGESVTLPQGGSKCDDPFPKLPTMANELMDLAPLNLKQGDVIKSLTGVVTVFCNLHIAPRSEADIVR